MTKNDIFLDSKLVHLYLKDTRSDLPRKELSEREWKEGCILEREITIVATQHQKTHKPRRAKRSQDTKIPQSSGPPKKVSDEAFYIREDDIVVRAATTASSLKTEQESCSGPRHQDTTLGGADAQTRFKTASKKSHDPPLSEVLALENLKTTQDLVIQKLKKRVKRLEKALRARTPWMMLFKIGTSRRKGLDKENGTLNSDSINVSTAGPSNVSDTGPSTSTAGDIFEDEMTPISDTLVAIRSARQRTISVMICNVEEEPRRATLKLASHLPQSCLRLTLEGFPFVTVNTKEYHSECSGKISRIMRRTLCYQMLFKGLPKVSEFDLLIYGFVKASGLMELNLSTPNGDTLRKCILKGPYTPTIVTTPVVPATENSPAVPEQTTVETVMNMTPENRAHFESEKNGLFNID
ncbi:hypothetical protein Tco_0363438 [Tanacetum coccineum]